MKALINFLAISRAKVQIVSFASATLGILLGADAMKEVFNWDILAFIILFYFTITFACNINCYFDIDVDRLRKKELQRAVSYFGLGIMKIILLSELLLTVILALYLWWRGHFEVALLAILGLFLGWAYSSPPLRIKGKGTLGPAPVIVGVYVLPIIAGYIMVEKEFTMLFILFVMGYAVMNLGINLVNICEDFSEDKKLGIKTIAHVMGLRNTLNFAFNATALGGILALLCLLGVGLEKIYELTFITALAALFLLFSSYTVFITANEIYEVGQGSNLEKSAKIHAKKMPKWFIITRYPIWCYALILLFL